MIRTSSPTHSALASDVDVVVVGAGFAGLYMLHRLRQLGLKTQVCEAGKGVGGTWYWNRYPGARCDVESMQYSYSFSEELQQEWQWTERYPKQDEILRYINHVADRFELRSDIAFETRISSAIYDAESQRWTVLTEHGDTMSARFLITAAGCLSAARMPDLAGLDSFKGQFYHTGNWPHEPVDFTGKRVGVIGTGSSGVQTIPVIARQASELVVFQRTPNFSIPAWNRPLSDEDQQSWKADYAANREKARHTRSGILYEYSTRATTDVPEAEREAEYERRWQRGGANYTHAFNDIYTNRSSNDSAAQFVRNKIHTTVNDPDIAALLAPNDHAIGTKRICVDTDYYQTFNQPHVSLVDLRTAPIVEIVPEGMRTAAATYDLDCIVFATGYDAVTGALDRIDIRGTGGLALKDKWTDGPRTYLGLMTAGFPNLFFITGPGSPSILTNVVVAIEQHVNWIANCLASMQKNERGVAEADLSAENDWVAHVNEVASKTLFPSTKSWFMGANIPGKPQVFLPYVGGFGNYSVICEEVVADDYRGFAFTSA
ncbi:NAD(P)/FAD-dependent oxidoreductase [Glaciimonas sp. CA11.2]|uniref:flavin-containing monooxygenase n=1 Tax=Glaciimonas sp. CA11.2 TaxID=3048601 RepID=UPI002AB3C6B8|nr:NAD(P)/FAD-dependent oxidoreductase [Glaciimonas sp. CA11.2]MDY7545292.1 NAD(P)/FAD-dependent oxidoreductase [Glaciimonas sp. CA11.2]MEB0162432.1 NAD(P)/FAD-dependent oxidoreductase [Glaciimonas sp. CA11.2]